MLFVVDRLSRDTTTILLLLLVLLKTVVVVWLLLLIVTLPDDTNGGMGAKVRASPAAAQKSLKMLNSDWLI